MASINSNAPTTVCVFCGSSPGLSPAYLEAARSLAHAFHKRNVHLVYGGGTVGLMGEIAKTLVSLSGPQAVHGIIPRALIKYEQAGRPTGGETPLPPGTGDNGQGVSPRDATKQDDATPSSTIGNIALPDENVFGKMTIVSTMHERKHLMTQTVLAGGPGSGFIALPGGYGTLEELAEVTTWNQLGIHGLGIVLFDVAGFYTPLLKWIQDSTRAGFISEKNMGIVKSAGDAEGCLRELREYQLSSARFDLNWDEK